MFLKGKDKDSSKKNRVFYEDDLENISLESGEDDIELVDLDSERDAQIEQLFKASTFDTSKPDKIIIRDIDARPKKVKSKKSSEDIFEASPEKPKKKVRRRVKKSSAKAVKVKAKAKKEKKTYVHQDYVPLASESDYNPVDSDFRAQSMDWKDSEYKADYSGLEELSRDLNRGSLLDDIRSMSVLQWAAAVLAVFMFVSAIMTTTVYAKLQCADRKVEALSRISSYEAASFEQVASAVEEVEAPISMEEAKPDIYKVLSLVLSSVEKDLKIKLVDEDDTLVKNEPWSVTITDGDGNASQQEDDDQDGIIHMTDISAGDYSVVLNPSDNFADYEIPTVAQTVSVKAKVEYKVIADIKEEIKSEKEINAAVEDANGNQAADVETAAPVADTVEWLESTKTAVGDGEYVEATPDLSKTAKAETGKLVAFLDKLNLSAKSKVETPLALKTLFRVAEEEHKYVYTSTNDGKHNAVCSVSNCETHGAITSEECSYTDGKCSKCGYIKPVEQEHKYVYTSTNDGKHNAVCSVSNCATHGAISAEECSYTDGKCSKCEYTKPAEQEHKYVYTSTNDGKHNAVCSVSNCATHGAISAEECSYTDGKCSKCEYTKPAEQEHKYVYTSTNDGKHNAVCSVSKCTTHKAISAEACTYKNGKCEKCGFAEPKKDAATISLSGTTSVAVNATTTITASMTPAGSIKVASPEDSSIAAVAVDGMKITVKGLKAGTTKINVEGSTGAKASISITVTAADKYSDDAQLYDASKNALYVKEGDTYRLAKYKDYKNNPNQKFYRKQETYLYTGWQTIDGKRYYYNRENKPVTGDQIIGGVKYSFGSDGALSSGSGTLGIDVSKYQPSINWSSVKASGVSYVIIRCGYRGSSTGVLVEDPYFKSHIKGAKAAGLKVGVYFFTTAVSEAEAVEEASMAAYLCQGYGIDYPIFMDCESSGRPGYNGMDAGTRTAIIKAFCNTIRSAGYTPGVYANKTWLSSYMHAGELSGYKIWLAQYNANGPTYGGRYDLWQYTSKGTINGISGYVDMNQSYLGY